MAAMSRVLVTGSKGFVGQNLMAVLRRRPNVVAVGLDASDGSIAPERLLGAVGSADVIFHLAGVNRPQSPRDYSENVRSIEELCGAVEQAGGKPKLVLSSSTQAALENPYGTSKRLAEEVLRRFSSRTGAPGVIYRLPGVFGKWCRPNYNSVVATFCHNIARGLPITVSDPANRVSLVYIDDVVSAFLRHLDAGGARRDTDAHVVESGSVAPVFDTTLGDLLALLEAFRDERRTAVLPDFSDPLTKRLYATYKSYLPPDGFAYSLEQRTDPRGSLAEFVKSKDEQLFVSRTKPGITRGNHYHDTKVEKFFVVEGRAVIRFRDVRGADVLEYPVSGDEFRVVDIPPGYTHSITNVGMTELVTLFWADEVFDPARPDTYACEVLRG